MMTADDLVLLAEDPRFIKGIYNYCDNWCERCQFTSRCLTYAQLQVMEDERGFDPSERDADNATFWQTLRESFAISKELIGRAAAKHGIDVHSPEFQAMMEESGVEHDRQFEAARSHHLTRVAERYAHAVDNWFNRRDAALQQRILKAQNAEEIQPSELQPEDVEDAMEVIRWYQYLPAAKLVGVLSVEKFEEMEEVKAMQEQSDNGSIKVALIGIDRSMLAWGRVQVFWPERAREVMHLVGLLAELRLWTERAFPDARDFIRPGFDEACALLM